MTPRRFVLIAAACAGAAAPAAAQPTGIFLDPSMAYVVPGGSVPIVAPGPAGGGLGGAAPLEVHSDLDGTGLTAPLPGLRFIQERYRFEVSYKTLSFRGGTAASSSPLARRALASSPLYTSLDVRNFGLAFRYDVYKRNGLSAGVGADYEDLSFTSYATDASGFQGAMERRSSAPLLTLGLNLTDATGRLFFDAQGGYFRLSSTEMQKARVEAGWSFAKYSGLKIGAETLRYRDLIGSAGTDLRLSNVSGGFFFNF